MSDKSAIEWTEATWNPVTGCSKVSQGCKHCYAEREWPRLAAPRAKPNIYTGREFTDVRCHPEKLEIPLRWQKPRRIFVNSMSDLFHEDVPDDFIDRVFAVMALADHHIFQVLTKRPWRMYEYLTKRREQILNNAPDSATTPWYIWSASGSLDKYSHRLNYRWDCGRLRGTWPFPNIWLGVSCENQATADERIPLLLKTPATVRWMSAEPLLGKIDLRRIGTRPSGAYTDSLIGGIYAPGPMGDQYISEAMKLDWIVAGGESGPQARPMHPDWVRSIRDQCQPAGVPFFFKQWGEWAPHTSEIEQRDGSIKTTPQGGITWRAHEPGGIVGMFRVGKKSAGRALDGRTWDEYPA